MPFDFAPQQPPADVFTLPSLLAWLEQQPGETEYEYFSFRDCLVCRYGAEFLSNNKFEELVQEDFLKYANHYIAAPYPRTYAAAATRCRAHMAEVVG